MGRIAPLFLVIAAALAWVLLGETLGWVEMAGALVVLAGIRIVHQAEFGRRKA